MGKVGSVSRGADIARKEASVYSRVTWRIIPFMFVCYIVAFLDRVNVGFAALQMRQDLHFSATVYGLGAGIFFFGYFLFEVPSNLLLEKFGARKWISRIMITWGIVSAATLFVRTATGFYICRFLLGVAEAGFFPGIILYLTYWYPKERLAHMTALFMTAIPVSAIIGGPLSGWILRFFHGSGGMSGWQWLFLLEGVPSIIMGVITLFYLDDSIASSKWLRRDEKKLLEDRLRADKAGKTRHSLADALLEWRVWVYGFIYFCYVAGIYAFSFWLPLMIKGTGIKNSFTIGLLVAIPNVVALIGMVVAGRSSDRTLERRWHLLVCSLVGGLGLVLSAASLSNTWLAVVAASLGIAGTDACVVLFWTVPTAILTGTAAAGGIALANCLGNLAGFFGPSLLGKVKDMTGSLSAGLFVLAGLTVVGGILVMIFGPSRARAAAAAKVQAA